jgi:hypothetical protein
MPRPTTKKQLLDATAVEWNALEQLLAGLSPAQMTQPGVVGDWSVKDVLAHVLEWQQMLIGWHSAGLKGKVPVTPSEKFNWAQLPQLNQQIYEKHRGRPLADIQKEFHSSHRRMLKIIQGLSEEDLFGRGRYAWTKNVTLGSYFTSGTSSHYLWARKNIKKGLKGS